MRKFMLLSALWVATLGFDIDDIERGMDAINDENFAAAYEIFSAGCEVNDEMACEELGLMYINEQITPQMDAALNRRASAELGVGYLMKSCDSGYLLACGDVVDLKKIGVDLNQGVYEKAKSRYDELVGEFTRASDDNSSEDNASAQNLGANLAGEAKTGSVSAQSQKANAATASDTPKIPAKNAKQADKKKEKK
jgi:ribosomal protein S4